MAEEPQKEVKPKIYFSYTMLESKPEASKTEPKQKKKPGRKPKNVSSGVIERSTQPVVVTFA
jgi:hypothetical protein